MYSKIFSSYLYRRIFVIAATVALFAVVACGGDDAAAAAPSPTQVLLPTPTKAPAEPTATPVPEPPAIPMIPATIPEPGSDEAQIMAVLEKQVIAINTEDYESFLETCTPSARKLPTIDQLKYIFEENRGMTESATHYIHFSPQGYNVRNVEVKLLRVPFAQAKFHVYDYEEHMGFVASGDYKSPGIVTWTFEKVDGQWYSEVAPC